MKIQKELVMYITLVDIIAQTRIWKMISWSLFIIHKCDWDDD